MGYSSRYISYGRYRTQANYRTEDLQCYLRRASMLGPVCPPAQYNTRESAAYTHFRSARAAYNFGRNAHERRGVPAALSIRSCHQAPDFNRFRNAGTYGKFDGRIDFFSKFFGSLKVSMISLTWKERVEGCTHLALFLGFCDPPNYTHCRCEYAVKNARSNWGWSFWVYSIDGEVMSVRLHCPMRTCSLQPHDRLAVVDCPHSLIVDVYNQRNSYSSVSSGFV